MSAKQIVFDQEAHEAIRRGVNKLSRAVRTTLGPRGRNVIFERSFGAPTVTKDGVTVAKEIELEDRLENVGAQMVREVASKTNDVAGDGTTTATVLADAIFTEGLKAVVAGVRPVPLRTGIERAVHDIVARLKEKSIPVKGRTEMAQVATIAGNNDARIGDIVAEAMDKVGKDGVVTIEEGKSLTTEVEFVEGMQFDKGFLSPYFVTDPNRMECVLDDAWILIHETKLSNMKSLLPLLEAVAQSGKPLLVVAEDVEGEALATLVINRLRGTFQSCAVKAPAYGDRRRAMMEDIATLTGATAIMESLGIQLENIKLDQLGRVKKVVIDKDNTTIIEGAGDRETIKGRLAQIERELENSTSDYDREKLQERKAKLSGGVARINVGGATEAEVKQKKALFEDALNATRAAVEEGILPGGGVALLRAAAELGKKHSLSGDPGGDDSLESRNGRMSHDEVAGYNVVVRACRSPLFWIASNGGKDGSIVCEKDSESRSFNYGYNAEFDRYENLVEAGVIDPTKVVRTALENAASVSTLLLTSDAVIAEKPKTKKKARHGHSDDYDMY